MSFSLRGSCFGGQASLGSVGGLWDDLFGESGGDGVLPVEGGTTKSIGASSPNAMPKIYPGDPCPAGMKDDPANPTNFCVYTAAAQAVKASCPGGTYYDPVTLKCQKNVDDAPVAHSCPAGHTIYLGKCVKVQTCPYGQTFNLGTNKCEAKYSTKPAGGGAIKPATPAAVTPPPDEAGLGDLLPLLAAGALLAGGGYLVYKKKQKKAGRAAA